MDPRRLILDLTDRKPTPTQDLFLQSESPLKFLCGGLGSGKTSTGADAFLRVVLSNPPNTDTMMAAPTLPMFRKFMQPAWERACPTSLIRLHHQTARYYLLRGNRRVWYQGAMHPADMEGANLVGFWGDEIRYWPARSFRNLNARRRDKRGTRLQGIITSTPAMGWVEEQFNRGLPGREVFRISTRENAHNLAPGYLEELERTYSPRLCRSLIEGDFSVVEGQVYESFDRARHIIDWQPDPSLPTLVWMDFGVRRASVLFAQVTRSLHTTVGDKVLPPNALVVFDELQPEDRATARVIPLIQARLAKHGIEELTALYCDPAGQQRDIASGMPSVHLLQSAFGPIVKYTTDPKWTFITSGIALIEGALNPVRGKPTLYFARSLVNAPRTAESNTERGVIKALQGYRYPETGTRDLPDKDNFYDHAMDALRYGVINTLAALGRSAPERVGVRHGGG